MGYYSEGDGLKYVLEKKETENNKDQFPVGFDNFTQTYHDIEKYMNDNIHNTVVAGVAANGDGLLNDHGVKHISTVILRASQLLAENIKDLTGYEIFILLLAIHFHDVGNIMGRDKHEEKIFEIINGLPIMAVFDFPVKRNIAEIAMAHGGYVDEDNTDKDTISLLSDKTYLNGAKIRQSMLAAVLRFADEIADDKTRVNCVLIDLKAIPEGNVIYHLYSKCLQPPIIEGDTIKLEYIIDYDYVINKYKKGDKEIYLYDEILNRLQKCLCELDYCRRYSQGFIKIIAISVSIEILDKEQKKIIERSNFKLRLSGYPDINNFDLNKLCVNKLKHSNGEHLKKVIEGETNE